MLSTLPALPGCPGDAFSIYRETRDFQSGEVLEALYPRKHGVSVEAANRLLVYVADLEVEIHYDCGACEPAPRSVKWADLEDTDGEDERRAEAAVGGNGVSEHAPESSGPRARMRTAAGGKGVSWHAPESVGSRAPSPPAGVSAAGCVPSACTEPPVHCALR